METQEPQAIVLGLFFGGSSRTSGSLCGYIGSFVQRLPVPAAGATASSCGEARAFGVPPRCFRQVLRVRKGRPLARPVYLVAFGRSLVRNSPRGETPKTPAMTEVACWESRRSQLRALVCGACEGRGIQRLHANAPVMCDEPFFVRSTQIRSRRVRVTASLSFVATGSAAWQPGFRYGRIALR